MIEFLWLQGDEARALDPDGLAWPIAARVLFVYDEGRLIGRSSVFPLMLIEGTWLHPDYRNGTTAARIVKEVERQYLEEGHEAAMAFVPNDKPEIADYMKRFGYVEQPIRLFIKPLAEKAQAA